MNKLSDNNREAVVNYYKACLKVNGINSAKSLDWASESTQAVRYEVFTKIGNLSGAEILDAGCGLGDFYKFLQGKNINPLYNGIDIVPEFVEGAKAKYPHGNFFLQELNEVEKFFDYIFVSGVYNLNLPNYESINFSNIRHLYGKARRAFGFNLLDERYHVRDRQYATYHPEKVLAFCKTFANRAALVAGYLPHDFTIFLYQ